MGCILDLDGSPVTEQFLENIGWRKVPNAGEFYTKYIVSGRRGKSFECTCAYRWSRYGIPTLVPFVHAIRLIIYRFELSGYPSQIIDKYIRDVINEDDLICHLRAIEKEYELKLIDKK